VAVKKAVATHRTHAKKKATTSRRVAGQRARVLQVMRRHAGTPYRYGGTTPRGFDCSGFTQYVYRQVGIKLPRTSSAQRRAGRSIPRSQGRPGDLVYMPGHVGIYLGNGMMYDSPRSGKRVGARKIWSSNYRIIRVIND
jgi:cell wall-associated NlpC family hydrolase